MELSYRPTWVKKSEVRANPSRYFVLDGRKISSVMDIPVKLRDALTPQLLAGPVQPIIPFSKMSNDFCTIISSDVAKNPVTREPGYPYYAFLPQVTEQLSYGTQFLSNPKEGPVYIGIVLGDNIPNLTLKSVSIIVRFGIPQTNENNIEGVTHLAPVPAEYQLFGTKDSLKPGQSADDLNWEVISNITTVLPDVWSIHAPTQLNLFKEGMDENIVRWHGFKFVVYKWYTDQNTAADPLYGLARFNLSFTKESLDQLKFLPYYLPDGAKLCVGPHEDEVVAYDLEKLDESKKPDEQEVVFTKKQIETLKPIIKDTAEAVLTSALDSLQETIEETVKKQIELFLNEKLKATTDAVAAFETTVKNLPPIPDENSVRGMVSRVVQKVLADKQGPVFTVLDGVVDAMKKFEAKIDELDTACGDNSDLVSAVIVNKLPGRAYSLTAARDFHRFYFFNTEKLSNIQIEASLPVDGRPGTSMIITNYRTDGGRIAINCKKGVMNLIYDGQIYPAMPSFALTKHGESVQLVFDGEKWYGTLLDGVQK